MFIKEFLYKLKYDINWIFRYPDSDLSEYRHTNYNEYWKEKRKNNDASKLSSWQKQRADYVLKMICHGSSVLDLGCGDGAVLNYLKEKAAINGIGVDVSEDILRKAENIGIKTINMNISILNDLDNLPEVDYVFGFEIIEHIPNAEEFMFKIQKKAKKGMIFSFPNTGYYAHRLRLLLGRFPLQWVVYPGEHLRFWTVKDVKWWIDKIGFNLDRIILYEGLPILNKLIPSLFGQGIIIKINRKISN